VTTLPTSRVVPGSGYTAALTWFTAAAMAFLAVFALALAVSAGRLADRWAQTLAQTATLRIAAPAAQMPAQTAAVLEILRTTPGVASVRVMDGDEQRALLAPWFGPEIPVETLALPRMIEIVEASGGFDPANLRLRLAAEAPGAVLDDHSRWRRPLVAAAGGLRALALLSVVLIGGAMAAMVTLAAGFSLAANAPVIRVLRLVGARDRFIARAFVRRFTLRALFGASVGVGVGALGLAVLPGVDASDAAVLSGLGLQGVDWLWLALVPPAAAAVAAVATLAAAIRVLRRQT
jgi:cell division transport system permease protein